MKRSRYHHGQLREALLGAAEELVRERGPEGWSLREVSVRVGVAPSAAYHHFSSRDALVTALAERVLTEAGALLERAVDRADTGDPLAPMVGFARAYLRWASDNPGLCAVVFAAAPRVASERVAPHPHGVLAAELDRLVEDGELSAAARPGADLLVWSAVHGLAVLCADGMIRHRSRRSADADADRMVRALMAGLRDEGPAYPARTTATTPHTERVAEATRAAALTP